MRAQLLGEAEAARLFQLGTEIVRGEFVRFVEDGQPGAQSLS